MALDWNDLAGLALLTLGYWLVDGLTRRDGLTKAFQGLGLRAVNGQALLVTAVAAGLGFVWRWASIPQHDAVSVVACTLALMLAWKVSTEDVDPVVGKLHGLPRILVVLCAFGTLWSPAFLLPVVFLLSNPFGAWEHHATLPMRSILALSTFAILQGAFALAGHTAFFPDATVAFFFVLTIVISHYWITAIAKIWLERVPGAWVFHNKLHHLAATSYSWGWARFLPWSVWRRFISVLKVFEKPMQAYAYAVELLAPIALLDQDLAAGMCIAWALFHVGVFSVSGLLFWDWIATDIVLAIAIWMLPESVASQLFGWEAMVASIVFMALFPLRHKLWTPIPLGWWDTPFTQRIHWRVTGESGKVYGLYNDFMCPNERLYGKVHACFLAPRKGITYHLGEVWKRDLRDAIREAGPDLDRLQSVRDRYGVEVRSEELAENHKNYLRKFFWALNQGAKKRVVPGFLKAPGDQCFYWGELPKYRGQEPVKSVHLSYREEYFDGDVLQRLHEEEVLELVVDETAADLPCQAEPTPRQIDDLLLEEADGKIIDLPKFGSGYVDIDDGKRREEIAS